MARGCALIDSRLDTAKIGSDGRVEVHRARLLAVFGETKNVSTRPGPDSDIGSGAQIGIVTLPRASITAHVRLANGRFVMVYPAVPSMNEVERDSKYLEAYDFGK